MYECTRYMQDHTLNASLRVLGNTDRWFLFSKILFTLRVGLLII